MKIFYTVSVSELTASSLKLRRTAEPENTVPGWCRALQISHYGNQAAQAEVLFSKTGQLLQRMKLCVVWTRACWRGWGVSVCKWCLANILINFIERSPPPCVCVSRCLLKAARFLIYCRWGGGWGALCVKSPFSPPWLNLLAPVPAVIQQTLQDGNTSS